MRLATLWAAYAILVATSWWGLWSIGNSLKSLSDDVCGAIVLDLEVQAGIVALGGETEAAESIRAAIVDVIEACG